MSIIARPKRVWTEAEIEALPEDGYIHELVDGELVVSPKNNFEHGQICARILSALMNHVAAHKLGVILDSSTGFWMKNKNCRAPDVSFLSRDRLRGLKHPPREFVKGAPELAVEVIAPSNTPSEITARLNDFFESGTRLAWIIHPVEEFVEICRSATDSEMVNSEGTLEGDDVIPGFSYPIADLFAPWDWEAQ